MRRLWKAALMAGLLSLATSGWGAERIPKDVHIYLDFSGSIVGSGKANKKLAEMMDALLSYRGSGGGGPFLTPSDKVIIHRFGKRLYQDGEFSAADATRWKRVLDDYGNYDSADGTTDIEQVVDDMGRIQQAATGEPRAKVVLIASDFIHDGDNDACSRGAKTARARQEAVAARVGELDTKIPLMGTGIEMPFTVGLLYVYDESPYRSDKLKDAGRRSANACFAAMLDESLIRKALERKFSTDSVEFLRAKQDIPAFVREMSRRIDDATSLPLRAAGPQDLQAEKLPTGSWAVRLELRNASPLPITLMGAQFWSSATAVSAISGTQPPAAGVSTLEGGESRQFTFVIPPQLERTLLGGAGFVIKIVDSASNSSAKPGASFSVASPGRRPLMIEGDPEWVSPVVPDALGNLPLALTVRNQSVRDNQLQGIILYLDKGGVNGVPIPITDAPEIGVDEQARILVPIPVARLGPYILNNPVPDRNIYIRLQDKAEIDDQARELHGVPLPATHTLKVSAEQEVKGSGNAWELPVTFSLGLEPLPERIYSAEVFRARDDQKPTARLASFDPINLDSEKQASQTLRFDLRTIVALRDGTEKFHIRFSCVRCAEPKWLDVKTPSSGSIELTGDPEWGGFGSITGERGHKERTKQLTITARNTGDIINEVTRVAAFPEDGRGEGERTLPLKDNRKVSIPGKEERKIQVEVPSMYWSSLFLGKRLTLQLYQSTGTGESKTGIPYEIEPPRPEKPLTADGGKASWTEGNGDIGYQLVVPFRNEADLPNKLISAFLVDATSGESVNLEISGSHQFDKDNSDFVTFGLPREYEAKKLLVRPDLHLKYRDMSHQLDQEGTLVKILPIPSKKTYVKGMETVGENDQPSLNQDTRTLTLQIENDSDISARVDGLAFYHQQGDPHPFLEYKGKGPLQNALYLLPRETKEITLHFDDEAEWERLREKDWAMVRAYTAESFSGDPSGQSSQRIATAILPVKVLSVDKWIIPGANGGMVASLRYEIRNKRDRKETHEINAYLIDLKKEESRKYLDTDTVEFGPGELKTSGMTVAIPKDDLDKFGNLKNAVFQISIKDTTAVSNKPVIENDREFELWRYKQFMLPALMILLSVVLYRGQRKEVGRLSAVANTVNFVVTFLPLIPVVFLWFLSAGLMWGMLWVVVATIGAPLLAYIAAGRHLRKSYNAQLRTLLELPEYHRVPVIEAANQLKWRHRRRAFGISLLIAIFWLELFSPYGLAPSNFLFSNFG